MVRETLNDFRKGAEPIPQRMLRWHLYGAGLENFGTDGKPEVVEVPAYGEDELLIRQDACGLCFSDTKVIALGNQHPRMSGRDLQSDPVTLGHEVACTVVGVGKTLQDRFQVGDRFVIQADVFYKGTSMAYGYAIRGGLAEYSVIGAPIINGDEGCYLLPLNETTGYVESALTEPWACVVSAYAQQHRTCFKAGGSLLVLLGAGAQLEDIEWMIDANQPPASLIAVALHANKVTPLHAITGLQTSVPSMDDLAPVRNAEAPAGFDDIIVVGKVDESILEAAASHLADHGIFNLKGAGTLVRPLILDIGRIHYNWHHYLADTGSTPQNLYSESRSAELHAGGKTWLVGAGGPMGQMHVQRAIQLTNPPSVIVATDLDGVRLQSVVDRFGEMAARKGINLIAINPGLITPDEFDTQLRSITGGKGFDDIVSLVPVAKVIEHAANFLASGGWFNIFAGVARGTMAALDANLISQRGCRFLGSSGSWLADMRATLERVQSGALSTNTSLAAIGGMEAAREGLAAVKDGRFTGKTLIFPLIHDLPLTSLDQLKTTLPTVAAKLRDGMFWTKEAEDELLKLKLGAAQNA